MTIGQSLNSRNQLPDPIRVVVLSFMVAICFCQAPSGRPGILSLLVGAAVMSMLLNLYGGVRRKMTQEFRAYGSNVVLAPGSSTSSESTTGSGVMDQGVMSLVQEFARQREA